jgi:GNAT superfamily N-acetyltransferase
MKNAYNGSNRRLTNMEFKPATPTDIPDIMAMIRELAEFERLAHECVGTSDELHQSLFQEQPVAYARMARVNNQVAGFALYFKSYSTFLCKAGIYLEDLYIRPAFRGQGIGKGMLLDLARLAREEQLGRLEWSVLNWNKRAIKFYESLGAKPVDGWTRYRMTEDVLKQYG